MTSKRRDDAVDNVEQLIVIIENDVALYQFAAPFNKHLLCAVDHDFTDGVVVKKLFQRAKSANGVVNFRSDAHPLRARHAGRLLLQRGIDDRACLDLIGAVAGFFVPLVERLYDLIMDALTQEGGFVHLRGCA